MPKAKSTQTLPSHSIMETKYQIHIALPCFISVGGPQILLSCPAVQICCVTVLRSSGWPRVCAAPCHVNGVHFLAFGLTLSKSFSSRPRGAKEQCCGVVWCGVVWCAEGVVTR